MSWQWRRRYAVLAMLVGVPLGACSGDGGNAVQTQRRSETKAPESTLASPERVAIQPEDLPTGFRKCAFAGEITEYMGRFAEVSEPMHQRLLATWDKLLDAGATAGFYATYGNSATACSSMQGGSGEHDGLHDPNDASKHPTTLFSFVTEYEDESTAAAAYVANVFGQANQRGPNVVVGEPTGLGPNATVITDESTNPVRQAVWQRRNFTVYLGTENLTSTESQAVMNAVDQRIG